MLISELMEQIKYLQFLQHVVIHYLGQHTVLWHQNIHMLKKLQHEAQKADVESYKESCASKSDLERTELNKDKTGVFTGAYAINPVNGKKIPIWISDYVLASYGTGAIMAVPAHDDRD